MVLSPEGALEGGDMDEGGKGRVCRERQATRDGMAWNKGRVTAGGEDRRQGGQEVVHITHVGWMRQADLHIGREEEEEEMREHSQTLREMHAGMESHASWVSNTQNGSSSSKFGNKPILLKSVKQRGHF